jgi:alanine dehydrogenase
MRYLTNTDVAELIDAGAAIDAMRAGYDDYRRHYAEQIPRADLVSRTGDSIHRLGVMAGASRHLDLAVVRIKSDVVSWSASGREEKYAGRPGLFAGIVLAFRLSDGAPVAILQDGLLQHVRVGAAAAIGTDVLAPRETPEIALLGSGGMAEAFLDSIALVRDVRRVRVYSPDAGRRAAFAARMTDHLGIEVTAVDIRPQAAVTGAPARALDHQQHSDRRSRHPGCRSGAHVTLVSRREIGADLLARADLVACLGRQQLSRPMASPACTLTRGGIRRVPRAHATRRAFCRRWRPATSRPSCRCSSTALPWTERPANALTALVAIGVPGRPVRRHRGGDPARGRRAGCGSAPPGRLAAPGHPELGPPGPRTARIGPGSGRPARPVRPDCSAMLRMQTA